MMMMINDDGVNNIKVRIGIGAKNPVSIGLIVR